jgi:hypothetical protein
MGLHLRHPLDSIVASMDSGGQTGARDSALNHTTLEVAERLEIECHKSVMVFRSNRCKTDQNQSRRGLRKRLTQ